MPQLSITCQRSTLAKVKIQKKNRYGQHDIFHYTKHILLPQKKNMSSYSIYLQIKSTVQLICLISYLIVNAEEDQSTPKESDCKQFYTTKGYHKTESVSYLLTGSTSTSTIGFTDVSSVISPD